MKKLILKSLNARIINYSSCITANIWNAAGIVFISKCENCLIALSLSFNKTKTPIFAVTASERIAKNLTLVWNVHPILIEGIDEQNQLIEKSIEKLKGIEIHKNRRFYCY